MTSTALKIIREEHAGFAAVLRSLNLLVDQGPGHTAQRFFEGIRFMLFYVDEFPERRHHPNESKYLFPALLRCAPELREVIERLESDHLNGERRVRELQHLLIAWEVLGDSRRQAFISALKEYVRFYLTHMQIEETELLPVVETAISPSERELLNAVFDKQRDPLAGGTREPEYDALFEQIALKVPAPIGVGEP